VLEPVEPGHIEARIVTHPNEKTYSLLAAPNWMGEDLDCQRRLDGKFTPVDQRDQSYGRYYLMAFRIKTVAGETTPWVLGWTKEKDKWRIFGYKLETP
jgi:hypothetical protein